MCINSVLIDPDSPYLRKGLKFSQIHIFYDGSKNLYNKTCMVFQKEFRTLLTGRRWQRFDAKYNDLSRGYGESLKWLAHGWGESKIKHRVLYSSNILRHLPMSYTFTVLIDHKFSSDDRRSVGGGGTCLRRLRLLVYIRLHTTSNSSSIASRTSDSNQWGVHSRLNDSRKTTNQLSIRTFNYRLKRCLTYLWPRKAGAGHFGAKIEL